MKYLKKFNESSTYHNEEISRTDFLDTYESQLPFSKFEFDKIKELVDKYGLTVISSINRYSPSSNIVSSDSSFLQHREGNRNLTIFYRSSPRISIFKLDDEWYLVRYLHEDKYYKCDSIDGLLLEIKRYID